MLKEGEFLTSKNTFVGGRKTMREYVNGKNQSTFCLLISQSVDKGHMRMRSVHAHRSQVQKN